MSPWLSLNRSRSARRSLWSMTIPDVCLAIKWMLARHRYSVLTATTVEEAAGLARRHPGPIHLLVVDMVMPVPGGEVAERVRAARPDAAVLYMSVCGRDSFVDDGTAGPARRDLRCRLGTGHRNVAIAGDYAVDADRKREHLLSRSR